MRNKQQHDESTLPKWAQEQLAELRRDNLRLQEEMEQTKRAKAVLESRNWYTITGPWESPGEKPEAVMDEVRYLWILYPNNPYPISDLKRGDVLLVGRATDDWQPYWKR